MPGLCSFCEKPDAAMACSVCKRVYYCGRECQKSDWKSHKVVCKTIVPASMVEKSGAELERARSVGGSWPADCDVLVRDTALPTMTDLFRRCKVPVIASFASKDATFNLLKFVLSFPDDKPLPKPALKQVREHLLAGADPHVTLAAHLPGHDSMAKAARATLSKAAGPTDVRIPMALQLVTQCAMARAVETADRGLLDTIKAHSKVPLDPKVVSMMFKSSDGMWVPYSFGDLFYWAVRSPRPLESMRMALELGAHPGSTHALSEFDRTIWDVRPALFLLTMGAGRGDPDEAEAILRLLVGAGADLNCVCSKGHTFLSEVLLCPISRLVPDSNHPGPWITPRWERLLRVALELGADPNLPVAAPLLPTPPLYSAVGALDVAEGSGRKITQEDMQALTQILGILKDAGADLRPEAGTCQGPHQLKGMARVVGDNYLRKLISMDCVPVIQWVLDNCKFNVNLRLDNTYPTYLFVAADRGFVVSTQVLLAAGVDPTVVNIDGATAAKRCKGMVDPALNGPELSARRAELITVLERAEAAWAAAHGQDKPQAGPTPSNDGHGPS